MCGIYRCRDPGDSRVTRVDCLRHSVDKNTSAGVEKALRQDVAKSTVTAVRALGWAATVLGMPAPAVFADVECDVGYAQVPALPPWSLLGKRVLSGCLPREHAFLAGRHLTFYRAEFFARVLFPDVEELERLENKRSIVIRRRTATEAPQGSSSRAA